MEQRKYNHGTVEFTDEDLKALAKIKSITQRGDNAEVRQQKGGQLSVYSVSKKKEEYI